jgi:hypothetical protein
MSNSFLERINFFKGFFTTADDWQKAQEYHIEKSKFHNRYLHIPGVVSEGNSLKVTAASQGTAVIVTPGYAIDGEGRDLYLPELPPIPFIPSKYHPPSTVYVTIKYDEEPVSKRTDPSNPDYTGYAFIKERPFVDITTVEPDNYHTIELARIELSADVTRLKDARDANNPVANEIDLRYVKKAGCKVEHETVTLADLGRKIHDSKTYIRGEDSNSITLETIQESDAHRFYLVSVYPDKEADIRWCIESSRSSAKSVQHKLILENLSKKAVNVFYRVYRLQ